MLVETLESRRLLSVAASSAAGTLYVYGDDAANGIRVALSKTSFTDIVVSRRVSGDTYAKVYQVADSKIDKIMIYARGGDDKIEVDFAVDANVTIYGGHGADWIKTGGNKCDAYGDYPTYYAPSPDDNAADTLIDGSKDYTRLWGQGGDDKLYAGDASVASAQLYGQNYLNGGAGNDRFYTTVGSTTRPTVVLASTGNDTLYARSDRSVGFYGGQGRDTVDFSAATEAVYVHIDGWDYSGSRSNPNKRHMFISGDTENVTGSSYSDDIKVDTSYTAFIRGGGGNDSIWGGGGNDTIYGGSGNDTIIGSDGEDSLYGEAGDDSLIGGQGKDRLDGGSGFNRYQTKDGFKDLIYGGSDSDSLTASDSFDVTFGVP
jgi:Ca2+-binding RTX toxin-like protein